MSDQYSTNKASSFKNQKSNPSVVYSLKNVKCNNDFELLSNQPTITSEKNSDGTFNSLGKLDIMNEDKYKREGFSEMNSPLKY